MAWIRVVNEKDAKGRLAEVYREVAGRRGKVADIMKVHSLLPDTMARHLELYLSVMFAESGLTREEKELVGVVVSRANRCEYCVRHHAEALDHYWMDRARTSAAARDYREVELTERQSALAEYADRLTRDPGSASSGELHRLRELGLSDEEILSANLTTAYFNFVNRIALGLGVDASADDAAGYRY
jgi:uncharacterized peroxidase-related enzyme